MNTAHALLRLTALRGIRCRQDLWRYVARMTGLVVFVVVLLTALLGWYDGTRSVVTDCLVVGIGTLVLALPISWEFGRMYLDLWESTRALRDLAAKDQQTGLLNNRSFVATVEDRLGAGHRLALIIGDLDRFKSINDLHGHLVGDEVIARAGEVLRDLFGETAVLGRMGGEEYAVVIDCPFETTEAAYDHAIARAEEMRRGIAEIAVPTERGTVTPTVSIGVAWSRTNDDFADLYARGDKALYVAKAAGRDRVVAEHEIELVDPLKALALRQDLTWAEAV